MDGLGLRELGECDFVREEVAVQRSYSRRDRVRRGEEVAFSRLKAPCYSQSKILGSRKGLAYLVQTSDLYQLHC